MVIKRILFLALVSILGFSCSSKILFTQDLRQKLESSGIGLDEIQFYNAREITLYSSMKSEQLGVEGGKIKLNSGKEIEEVRIRQETPGVCEGQTGDKVTVAFEPGPGKTLTFFRNSYGKYQIYAPEWVKRRFGKIEYDGKTFFIQPEGNQTLLLVKKSQINKISRKYRTAKGVKIGG